MTQPPKSLWEILVPCQYNDGTPVSTKHHKEWDRKVREFAGGLTVLKPATGQWVNDGTVYYDRTIPVRVLCSDKDMKKIITMTMLHYEQLAVIAYVISERAAVFETPRAIQKRFQRKDKVRDDG